MEEQERFYFKKRIIQVYEFFKNLEIKFSKKISIQRNKNFQRILERKKVQLELYSTSTQFFIMKKKTLIAKTSLKLDNLLNKCEIHEIFSVRLYLFLNSSL